MNICVLNIWKKKIQDNIFTEFMSFMHLQE